MSRVIRLAAVSAGHSSRPYLLYDIEADARSLVESAREKAQAIIEETVSRLLEMFSEPQEAGRTEREMQEVEEGRK